MKKELDSNKKLLPPGQEEDLSPDGNKVTSKVKIKAPPQQDGKSVYYTVGDLPALADLADPDYFQPGRQIANIILDKDTPIDPAVELSLEITAEDVQRAGGQKFRLAYHDGTKWVKWPDEFASQTGMVKVSLSKRGDPAIGLKP